MWDKYIFARTHAQTNLLTKLFCTFQYVVLVQYIWDLLQHAECRLRYINTPAKQFTLCIHLLLLRLANAAVAVAAVPLPYFGWKSKRKTATAKVHIQQHIYEIAYEFEMTCIAHAGYFYIYITYIHIRLGASKCLYVFEAAFVVVSIRCGLVSLVFYDFSITMLMLECSVNCPSEGKRNVVVFFCISHNSTYLSTAYYIHVVFFILSLIFCTYTNIFTTFCYVHESICSTHDESQ